jgi:hypothetical protein
MKNCKFCEKEGLFILPLRYSVVVADIAPAELQPLPALLGDKISDIQLKKAKYAPRMLRRGYIYILIRRNGLLYWESYVVTDEAFLYKFPIAEPPQTSPEFTCARDTCGIDASMISIEKPEFVEKIYLIFTPSAMTMKKLAEFKEDPEKKVADGQMQTFSPSAWCKGSVAQAHSLVAAQLKNYVPEFILAHQPKDVQLSSFGKIMLSQLFPAVSDAYTSTALEGQDGRINGRLGRMEQKSINQKSAAIALFDSIGITQELNNFRNSALVPVCNFLDSVDKGGISNQRKMEVMLAIDDVKNVIVEKGVAIQKKNFEIIEARNIPDRLEDYAAGLRRANRISEAQDVEKRIARNFEKRERRKEFLVSPEHALQKWKEKYETQISVSEIIKFRTALERVSSDSANHANQRAADHTAWIKSSQLVEAFDCYDQTDLASGFCFTMEHSICTFGMFGNKNNIDLLRKWMDIKKVDRKNLYMRSNYYNSKALIVEVDRAFGSIRDKIKSSTDVSDVSNSSWLKLAKGLIDGLKKTDSAWDEWLRDKEVREIHQGTKTITPGRTSHNLSNFHRSAEGMMFARIAEWSQALSTPSGKLDKAISGIVGMMLYTRLGELAEKIGFDEYMLKIKTEKIKAFTARKQESEQYQKRANEQKQKAKANINKAAHDAKIEASAKAKLEAESADNIIDELIRDEQNKVKAKVKITLDEMDREQGKIDGKVKRPDTNNFRHARLGVVLMSIESLSLTLKIIQFEKSPRLVAEISASILALASMSFDILYAVTKSIREIEPFEAMKGINKAADVMRGGFKLAAGILGTSSGVISSCLDFNSASREYDKSKADGILVGIYISRGGMGLAGAGFGLVAAFSYTAPFLAKLAGSQLLSKSVFAMRLVNAMAASAVLKSLVLSRTLMLIRLARFNLIGLALTVVEVGYRLWIKDDELENWLQSCTFRLDKSAGLFSEKSFPDTEAELLALKSALKEVGL